MNQLTPEEAAQIKDQLQKLNDQIAQNAPVAQDDEMLKYVESLQQRSQFEEQHLNDLREIYELAQQQGIDPQPLIEQLGFGDLGM